MTASATTRGVGPGDPLGPVDQDVDEIRLEACRLVAPDRVCSSREPPPPELPSGDGGSWAAAFEVLVWVVFFAMVAALVFVVVRVAMTATFAPRRRRSTDEPGDEAADLEGLSPVVVDRTREPADWRREAQHHRAAARYREAVRCRYRALVGDLARRGLVDEIPGRTSGEERVQMSIAAPREAPAFASAAELFDQAWFGDLAVGDDDVQQMEALETRVLTGLGAPAP